MCETHSDTVDLVSYIQSSLAWMGGERIRVREGDP